MCKHGVEGKVATRENRALESKGVSCEMTPLSIREFLNSP
jgi:hypothetical protein